MMWKFRHDESKELFSNNLAQMLPVLAAEEVEHIKKVTEDYQKYKSGYMKNIWFNLDEENGGKCFFFYSNFFHF